MAAPQDTKVVTGEVRLSFVHLLEPYAQAPAQGDEPSDPKYSCMILVPKTDTATIRKIEKAQQAALENGKAKVFGGTIPKAWKNTFRDADEEMDTDKYPEAAGCMFMTISSKKDYPPGIVDRALNPLEDRRQVYSGMYARVSMNAFPFAARGNKGVSFGLNNVQKTRDGERLGGSASSAEDDFDALDDEDGDGVI